MGFEAVFYCGLMMFTYFYGSDRHRNISKNRSSSLNLYTKRNNQLEGKCEFYFSDYKWIYQQEYHFIKTSIINYTF